jgi:small subunit ribosomal protein S16
MSVKLRLTRVGGRKDPRWRVVAADGRAKRDGRVIEIIGHYNAQTDPSTFEVKEDRVQHWLERGAQPSGAVRQLLKHKGIGR